MFACEFGINWIDLRLICIFKFFWAFSNKFQTNSIDLDFICKQSNSDWMSSLGLSFFQSNKNLRNPCAVPTDKNNAIAFLNTLWPNWSQKIHPHFSNQEKKFDSQINETSEIRQYNEMNNMLVALYKCGLSAWTTSIDNARNCIVSELKCKCMCSSMKRFMSELRCLSLSLSFHLHFPSLNSIFGSSSRNCFEWFWLRFLIPNKIYISYFI